MPTSTTKPQFRDGRDYLVRCDDTSDAVMTPQANRMALFDDWAAQYDLDVATGGDDFPFAGYDEVLATAIHTAGAR
jgi:hypothetical protein